MYIYVVFSHNLKENNYKTLDIIRKLTEMMKCALKNHFEL